MNSAKKVALVLAAAGMAIGASISNAAATDGGGASAAGVAKGSPGIVSGDVIQIPLDVPINLCGNSIDVLIGLLNPTFGNTCVNAEMGHGREFKHHRGHHHDED